MGTLSRLFTGIAATLTGHLPFKSHRSPEVHYYPNPVLPDPYKHSRAARTSGRPRPSGSKMIKAARRHRLDHSNPGGVVSNYFREKNSRVENW